MRKLSLLLLLATVAAPALAQADDRGDRRHRAGSSDQSESRSQGASESRGTEARERRSSEGRASESRERRSSETRGSESRERRSSETRGSESREQRAFGSQRSERSQANQQETTEGIRERFQQRRQQAESNRSGGNNSVRDRRVREGASGGGEAQTNWRERERRVRTIPDTRPTTAERSTTQREGFRDRNRRDYRDGNYNRWSHDWRNDRRYDWRRHRDRNRSSFRIGFYYDPFGWNYRRWSVGSLLHSSYYGSRYWLNDPWQYRLPPAYGPYRWVRYWNDALLVNTYTGEVVDVIHGFFW